MRGYDRDEYEDLDEYEEDGEEYDDEEGSGEEYEEEETHQPTQEELEYLELRQRLKESIRKKMKKELVTANPSSRDKTIVSRKDNYGSFFGPSQPVIAQRVIEESKSLLENPNLAARVSKSNHANNKSSVSTTIGSKPRVDHPPRVVTNGAKRKIEVLKNARDYSFLLSDDAEVPAPTKNPPAKNISAPISEARSVQFPPRSKQPVRDSGKRIITDHLERRPMPAASQTRPKAGSENLAPATKSSIESKKWLAINNGSGPGRPLGLKVAPSRIPAATAGKKVTASIAKSSMPGYKPKPSPLQPPVRKPTHAPLQASVSKKPLVQRKESQETSKPKIIPKQPMASSRPQVKLPIPKSSAHSNLDERRNRKHVRREDEDSDDGGQAISLIRKMFRYNPNKYGDEDDDSDMEANFDDIMREESRSAKIAKKEDEEQLRLIEEEERRERMRMAKKRKQSH